MSQYFVVTSPAVIGNMLGQRGYIVPKDKWIVCEKGECDDGKRGSIAVSPLFSEAADAVAEAARLNETLRVAGT